MKFNKWTVALAAIGVVSLTSAAKAEEKASSVMTALSSTTLSGYVDTSAQWNPGTGNTFVAPYKFNSPSKADGFNLDVVQLRIEKPLDESEWAAGYRVDLWAGPDANTLGTQSVFGSPNTAASHGDFAIRQAYAALRVPVGNGLDWKVGVFDSILGYESVESPNNPNYTRSYGHSIEPQTHTGVLMSYRFSDLVSASAGVANTMGPVINSRAFAPVQPAAANAYPESYKTYMASLAVTAPDSMGFLSGSTLYGGVVNGFNNSIVGSGFAAPELNAYVGATIATPVTGLRLGAAWDFLNVNTTPHSGLLAGTKTEGEIWSIAGYASYQATEKLSLHGRFEYASGEADHPAALTGISGPIPPTLGGDLINNGLIAVTATVQYDLWKNVLSRIEFRWDHTEHGKAFGGVDAVTGGANRENAYMLGANIIYKF
jgi:hypothetical protein